MVKVRKGSIVLHVVHGLDREMCDTALGLSRIPTHAETAALCETIALGRDSGDK